MSDAGKQDDAEPLPRAIRIARSRIMYVERKAGNLEGEAVIGRVFFSKSGATLYYKGKKFRSLKGIGFKANYFEVQTGEQYWISGPKMDRNDRLYGGHRDVQIDDDVRAEYFALISGGV